MTRLTTGRDADDVLFCDEFRDDATARLLRLTVDADGEVYLAIEAMAGPLNPTVIRGGEALLIWLQANGEAALFVRQRAICG